MPNDFRSLSDLELTQKVDRVKTNAGFGLTGGILGLRGSRLIAEYNRRANENLDTEFNLMSSQIEDARALAVTPEAKLQLNALSADIEVSSRHGDFEAAQATMKLLGQWASNQQDERIAAEKRDEQHRKAVLDQYQAEQASESARIEGMYERTQDLIGERTERLAPIADGIQRMETVRNLVGVESPAAIESAQLALAAYLNEGRPTDKDAEAVKKLGSFMERQRQALTGIMGGAAREAAYTQMNAMIDAIQVPMRSRAQTIVTELDERAKHGLLPVVDELWNAGYDRSFYTEPTVAEPFTQDDTDTDTPSVMEQARDAAILGGVTATSVAGSLPGPVQYGAAAGAGYAALQGLKNAPAAISTLSRIVTPSAFSRILGGAGAGIGGAGAGAAAGAALLWLVGKNAEAVKGIRVQREGETAAEYRARVARELTERSGAPFITPSDIKLPEGFK